MIDEIKLKMMKKKPSIADLASPNLSEDAKVAVRVAMRRANKDQEKIAKKAAQLGFVVK